MNTIRERHNTFDNGSPTVNTCNGDCTIVSQSADFISPIYEYMS